MLVVVINFVCNNILIYTWFHLSMTITFIRELNMNLQETDGKKNFMCQWYKAYCVIQL